MADYGQTLLLQAQLPQGIGALGQSPSYLWDASTGSIEAQSNGQALWHVEDGPAPGVATCAVQCGEMDIQVGSYRLG